MARAHGDPGATLQLIGKPATDSYVAALHRYVAELGLAAAVQFAGHASDATVAAAYASADVLVVTSEHEGFCVPVVEAMAAGVPVVAFDQGAVPEVLGGAGVLVSDKDPYALAAAIAALLRDARRRDDRRSRRAGSGWRCSISVRLPTVSSTCWSRWPRPPPRRRERASTSSSRCCTAPMRSDGTPCACATSWWSAASPRTFTWRWTTRRRRPRPAPSPGTPKRPKRATCWSTSAPPPRPSAPGWAPRAETLVVNYHNVTPPEYYAPWDNGMARHQLLAQTQLRELAPRAALGLAVSAFNESELRQAGFRRTAVVPPAAMAPTDRHVGATAANRATTAVASGAR